jgi:hydroxymethylpyrimidine/phosphomethylpyrimidine kinase
MPLRRDQVRVVLTIAGSDSGGGAGLEADLKTFLSHRVHGTVAVTCVTAQNTLGVQAIERMPRDLVLAQMVAVLDDLRPEAAKTGFLAGTAAFEAVAELIDRLPPLVVDPVCVDKHNRQILGDEILAALRAAILPRAALVTPNLAEAALLTGLEVRDRAGMEAAASALLDTGVGAVLIKGGRLGTDHSPDLLATRAGVREWLDVLRVHTTAVHGSGDTLAAAIAARLAWGSDIVTAARLGKEYVTACLERALEIGQGQGPIGHVPAPMS